MIDFKNKKILITGASGGIGSALVKKFVSLGGSVLGTGTKAEKLAQLRKKIQLTKAQAKEFYIVHQDRPFYNDLINFMISGPVVVQVLEGENAVQKNRNVMGATNPKEADEGTIRKEYALSLEANSVHGSDSEENAEIEISFFFSKIELVL